MHTKKLLLKNKKLQKVVFYLYLGLVLYLTLSPIDEIRPSFLESFLFEGADKIVHAGIFTVLAVLYYITYKVKYLNILLIVAVIGILIEILQKELPTGRSFDWIDWVFDIFGGVIGIVIIHFAKPHVERYL